MKLLYIGDKFQDDDNPARLEQLSRSPALIGHKLMTSFQLRDTATEVSMLCQAHGIEGVICSQLSLLKAALRQLPDYIPPVTRKGITLDDYAGSWIDLPRGIPMIVINPLHHLHTVPYGKFILNRYLSKLTKPSNWFAQTPFLWQQVHENNCEELLREIQSADFLAIDIETPGDELRSIKLVGYCAYWKSTGVTKCYVVHLTSEWAYQFCKRANKSKAEKIFQGGIYDNSYFFRWDLLPDNWLWDTMNMMHCWYSEFPKRLDFVASFALRKMRYWKDDGKTGSLEDEMRYNALDCWATMNSFLSMMREWPTWAANNYLQEFPMNFPALNAMMEGWKIDEKRFAEVSAQKEEEAAKHLEKIRFWLGAAGFNPRSPQQMKDLFKVLGCGSLPDTAKASMLKARAASPLNEVVLGEVVKYKEAAKLNSTYLDAEKIWNGRWYYSIDMAGTDTGRGASRSSPFWCGDNIQNVPRGDTIKSYYVADTGWLLAEPDKAQSEARCVGYLAGEQSLIDLVEGPHDYHAWNAQAFFGVPYEKIYDEVTRRTLDKDLRDLSKRTNHGANYNMGASVMLDTMGPKKVAEAKRILGLPARWTLHRVCEYLLEQYEKTYPRVKGLFYDHIIGTIELTNRLVSPLGWTRYFFAKPSRKNKPALNTAVAHSPQNLSVAIINREWYAIWRRTVYGDLLGRVRIKAQIHDSLPFQYRIGDEAAAEAVREAMNTPVAVRGADGITRTMVIPSDIKKGDRAWSNLK